jgi:hypothetical protein
MQFTFAKSLKSANVARLSTPLMIFDLSLVVTVLCLPGSLSLDAICSSLHLLHCWSKAAASLVSYVLYALRVYHFPLRYHLVSKCPSWRRVLLWSEAYYCTISFKSTGGVTRDAFYLFDISAAAESLRDTSKISAFEPEFLSFLPFIIIFRQFGACVTTWRFARGLSDVWPRPKFVIDSGVRDAWLPIWTKSSSRRLLLADIQIKNFGQCITIKALSIKYCGYTMVHWTEVA